MEILPALNRGETEGCWHGTPIFGLLVPFPIPALDVEPRSYPFPSSLGTLPLLPWSYSPQLLSPLTEGAKKILGKEEEMEKGVER